MLDFSLSIQEMNAAAGNIRVDELRASFPELRFVFDHIEDLQEQVDCIDAIENKFNRKLTTMHVALDEQLDRLDQFKSLVSILSEIDAQNGGSMGEELSTLSKLMDENKEYVCLIYKEIEE